MGSIELISPFVVVAQQPNKAALDLVVGWKRKELQLQL